MNLPPAVTSLKYVINISFNLTRILGKKHEKFLRKRFHTLLPMVYQNSFWYIN